MIDSTEIDIQACEQRIAYLRSEQLALECGDDFLFTNRNGNYPQYESMGRELTALYKRIETLKGPARVATERLMRHPLSEWFNFFNAKELDSYKRRMENVYRDMRVERNRIKTRIRALRKSRASNDNFMVRLDISAIQSYWDNYKRLSRETVGYRKMVGAK